MDYGGYDRVKIDSLRQIRWVLDPRAAFCCENMEQRVSWNMQLA